MFSRIQGNGKLSLGRELALAPYHRLGSSGFLTWCTLGAIALASFLQAEESPRAAPGVSGNEANSGAAAVNPSLSSPGSAAASTLQPDLQRKRIQRDGETFELAASTASRNVETDEYVLSGEKIADWTQLLTVQRLTLPHPTATDEFLAYFQRRVQGEEGASLEILKKGKPASVFAVRFPKSDRNDEQVMICLAFADPAKPALLNIVQYAIKPTRMALAAVESHIRSWRDQFVQQADAASAKERPASSPASDSR